MKTSGLFPKKIEAQSMEVYWVLYQFYWQKGSQFKGCSIHVSYWICKIPPSTIIPGFGHCFASWIVLFDIASLVMLGHVCINKIDQHRGWARAAGLSQLPHCWQSQCYGHWDGQPQKATFRSWWVKLGALDPLETNKFIRFYHSLSHFLTCFDPMYHENLWDMYG